ncbi:MAG: EAL domain-containing protein [Oleiphilaceae bacterium]|nr:EAL domain-containing protein [Oleiphilaceae bacterium]
MSSEPQKILLVDDVPANLAMLEAIVSGSDTLILKAHSGHEALDLTQKHDVSLILLDVVMPDMNGHEVAMTLRAKPETQYIPIIFITGSERSNEVLVESYQSGGVDVLFKPIEPEIIRAKVKIFLELDQQRRLIHQQRQSLEKAFQQLQHYAQLDRLTGMYNRDEITNILVNLMERAKRDGRKLALLFLDLDHFKNINDSLGHDVGDMLLKSVAQRVQQTVRKSDFVARLGGDEFAVILDELEREEDAGLVAQKILDNLVLPHELERHEILVSSSIGIALYDDSYLTAADLLKAADAAMYQAKRKGRSQFAYFSPELEAQALKRMEIARALNEAISENELSVFYQPQFRASNGELIGFEALMRWHRKGEWISPALFIPIAEESGLIPRLGEWILRHCCHQLKQWQNEGIIDEQVKVAVNISNRQIQANNFLQILEDALKESQLPPHCLELELTESTVMDDPKTTISMFNKIHALGVEIAVDDFGTGYSSLNYLRQLPLDCLKIDQSFVKDISVDRNDEAIVKAIIGLSHTLGLKVVAEGVENETQSHFLRQHQCDTLQGYLFGRPIPATKVAHFVASQNNR